MAHSYIRLVAWRFLWGTRKKGFAALIAGFSFLGIVLGVATLIIVMSVMNGFRHELLHRVLGMNGHVTVYSNTLNLEDYPSLQRIIEKSPYVASCNPLIEKQGLFLAQGASGGIIRGAPPQALQKRNLIAQNMKEGSLKALHQPHTAVVGHKLARKLNLQCGKTLKIMVAQSRATAIGFFPRTRSFRVVGIFDSGMHEYDQSFVFTSLESAQTFWEMAGSTANSLEIFLQDPQEVKKAMADIHRLLITHMPQKAGEILLYDWQKSNSHFFHAIEVQRNVMFLILMLIILVAVFNVIACLVMLVQDKMQDIAVLRTLGATRSSILGIFLFVGGFIGVTGTALGTLLGLLFSYHIDGIRQVLEACFGTQLFQAEIYFLSHLPAQVRLEEVALVVSTALAFCFLATLYPAWKASRLNPVEGLRYG